jgi:acyl dehydratase
MLNFDAVGQTVESGEYVWTSKDAMLYALAVGCSQGDATADLQFTTENSANIEPRALPTFGSLIAQQAARRPSLGDVPAGMALHAEQAFIVSRELPVAGRVVTRSTVTGIYDKTSGALVTGETEVIDAETKELFLTAHNSTFVRGEGGFGGDRGPAATWEKPSREPDHLVVFSTRPEQALLYRLTGDRNPLHSDPALALARGNSKPILHGMCTYGFTGRALLKSLCDGDPARFKSMTGRFTSPVTPGDDLHIAIWVDGPQALFQTTNSDGWVVLDHGRCEFQT